MHRRGRFASLMVVIGLIATFLLPAGPSAIAVPNPVATDENTYQAFGRVFPDPHGCLAYGVPDVDGNGLPDTPRGISPWAKGRVCADAFLSYQEVLDGSRFLQQRFPRYLDVIRLDDMDPRAPSPWIPRSPEARSAGLPRTYSFESGELKAFDRDRRPLYMFKVTDKDSTVPEAERLHFAVSLSIHGIERAGLEGGARAMEDLVTWAACENGDRAATTPACTDEGPFPKKIIETPTEAEVPTAGEALENAVLYFLLPNPDGWARGQIAPFEVEDGNVNPNYLPNIHFQRYNGNGVDINRDWPTIGYTYKPYSPSSEPETKAFEAAMSAVRDRTPNGSFAGGLDLHGMITANAFSYTLIGSGQRDFRKNALTVDTSIRTWRDQTQRLAWSPWVADSNGDGKADPGEPCARDLSTESGVLPQTRGRIPACVADEWGTVIDTIGYQVTGSIGDWFDSPLGLDAVGINNEMYTSHLAPNSVFEPALEQTHIDGNKGLIFSQVASLLTSEEPEFVPGGRVAYVNDPVRLQVQARSRVPNPGLPAQRDFDVLIPCQNDGQNSPASCDKDSTFVAGTAPSVEFRVRGPDEGIWNGGMTITTTHANANGVGIPNGSVSIQQFHEGQWQTITTAGTDTLYAPAGRILSVNDPEPGRWRVLFSSAAITPARVNFTFDPFTAEASSGQAAIDASAMDFFTDLNDYAPDDAKLSAIDARSVARRERFVQQFDTVVLVDDLGTRSYLTERLGLSATQADAYFANLRTFVEKGGNLVLTDGALRALAELGVVKAEDVRSAVQAPAPNYNFTVAGGAARPTYEDPANYPLAARVGKPGAAEQVLGRRQAAEPTPLGYTPDTGDADDPKMPYWYIPRAVWESPAVCGKQNTALCTTATADAPRATTVGTVTGAEFTKPTNANLGEIDLGAGHIRIAGILLPDPHYSESEEHDNRFGLASYALTYTSYEVIQNLIDWTNPARVEPYNEIATALSFTEASASSGKHTDSVRIEAALTDVSSGEPIASQPVTLEMTSADGVLDQQQASTNSNGIAVFTLSLDELPGEYGLVLDYSGTDQYTSTSASRSFMVERELTKVRVDLTGSGSNRKINGRLTDDELVGVGGAPLNFYANEKLIGNVTTNSNGVAQLTLPSRYRGGKHTFKVVFDGTPTHEGSTGSYRTKG